MPPAMPDTREEMKSMEGSRIELLSASSFVIEDRIVTVKVRSFGTPGTWANSRSVLERSSRSGR